MKFATLLRPIEDGTAVTEEQPAMFAKRIDMILEVIWMEIGDTLNLHGMRRRSR